MQKGNPKNPNASASANGYNFQNAAAVFLFLHDIKKTHSARVEGKKQDIQITDINGKTEYIQVKSIHDPETSTSSDWNLVEALISLTKNAGNAFDSTAYCSNQKKNFILHSSDFLDDSPRLVKYTNLSLADKRRIDDLITSKHITIDKNKFRVIKIPFNQGEYDELPECLVDKTIEFLKNCGLDNKTYLHEELIRHWSYYFANLSALKNTSIELKKESLIYVVFVDLIQDKSYKYLYSSESMSEELYSKYRYFVSDKKVNYQVISAITNLYWEFLLNHSNDEINLFISSNKSFLWDLLNISLLENLEEGDEILKYLVITIIELSTTIERIKSEVSL